MATFKSILANISISNRCKTVVSCRMSIVKLFLTHLLFTGVYCLSTDEWGTFSKKERRHNNEKTIGASVHFLGLFEKIILNYLDILVTAFTLCSMVLIFAETSIIIIWSEARLFILAGGWFARIWKCNVHTQEERFNKWVDLYKRTHVSA